MTFTAMALFSLLLEAFVCFALPVGLMIFWRSKSGSGWKPVLVGAAMFFLFAMVLEQILHTFVLVLDTPIKAFVTQHAVAYMLYGSFAAGIFEETGRLLGFLLMKKDAHPRTAVAYGLGHGGMEMMLLVGVSAVSNVVLGVLVGKLGIEGVFPGYSAEQLAAVTESVQAIFGVGIGDVLLALLERCSALIVQVSLSVLVFAALHQRGKWYYYPVAIVLHAVLDMPVALYQFGVLTNLVLLEGLILVLALVYAALAYRVYRGIGRAYSGV